MSNDSYSACQALRIYNVVTGRLLSFRPPPGTVGWLPLGIGVAQAIAPSGRMIAAYAATLPPGRGRGRLFVLRLGRAGGPPRAVPSSAGDGTLSPRTAWSADGSWLFYQGPGGHLWAYQVSSGRVRASGVPCWGTRSWPHTRAHAADLPVCGSLRPLHPDRAGDGQDGLSADRTPRPGDPCPSRSRISGVDRPVCLPLKRDISFLYLGRPH